MDWKNIHVAEYIAVLITCETFARQCAGLLTYLDIDNKAARAWFDKARCPRFPVDRCGQGAHLFMLEKGMKVKTNWIASSANAVADKCSRKAFPMKAAGIDFGDIRLRRIKPRWQHVLKFI